ncbi:uncharacterized protein A4U43_C01F12840 [Asparagus officinalis]|uniref:Lipoyl-binding domain-containing protein n=1 Tax=Asparagus officinalis TaxID=4686 RepID=A0A5P1FQL1_ASPOF|nr:uncharacterized protein A4U43_C01F12840 [Asparagus officinalis]
MNVETFYDGYLASIMVEEGGVAPVGSAIALLAETEAEIEQARSKAQPSSSSSETLDSYSPPAQQEALDSERTNTNNDNCGCIAVIAIVCPALRSYAQCFIIIQHQHD